MKTCRSSQHQPNSSRRRLRAGQRPVPARRHLFGGKYNRANRPTLMRSRFPLCPSVIPVVRHFAAARKSPPIMTRVYSDANQNSDERPAHPRVLGLDVGSRRIGLAVSDPLGLTAQGLETLQRQNKRLDFEKLQQVIREYQVSEIVVGYPLRMSGEEGIQAEKMQLFAEELRQWFKLPVHLWDERLTSTQANRLLRETDMSIRRRGQVVDQMAAVLILQNWMDSRDAGFSVSTPERP